MSIRLLYKRRCRLSATATALIFSRYPAISEFFFRYSKVPGIVPNILKI